MVASIHDADSKDRAGPEDKTMIKTIGIDQLRKGMFLHEIHGSWLDHPFWKSRFLLKDQQEIDKLRNAGIKKVSIDVSKGLDVAPRTPQPAPDPPDTEKSTTGSALGRSTPEPKYSMQAELQRARKICQQSKQQIQSLFSDVRMGKAVSSDQVQGLVGEITDSVTRNPDAIITLARLKTADDYTYLHSVAVCALMIALARELGMDEDTVHRAGIAGLLHDAGKMLVPGKILNKPGQLTDEEFAIIKSHPVKGAEMLQQAGEVMPEVIDVCLHHHEKMDGSGYPKGLDGQQISTLARMGAICDVYDAITSDRAYKKGWSPAESLGRMTTWCGGHFDEILFQAFVKTVGIYPVGSLVRLKSERLAVVIEQNESSLLSPVVKVFFSVRSGMPLAQEIVDLSRPTTADSIAARESIPKWRFQNLDELWQ